MSGMSGLDTIMLFIAAVFTLCWLPYFLAADGNLAAMGFHYAQFMPRQAPVPPEIELLIVHLIAVYAAIGLTLNGMLVAFVLFCKDGRAKRLALASHLFAQILAAYVNISKPPGTGADGSPASGPLTLVATLVAVSVVGLFLDDCEQTAVASTHNAASSAPPSALNGTAPPASQSASGIAQLQRALLPTPISELDAKRFLLVNKGDATKAAAQYQAMLAWRKREGIDEPEPNLSPTVQAALDKYYRPSVLDGPDFAGRPVMVVSMGVVDFSALKQAGVTTEILSRRHGRTMDALQRRIDAMEDPMKGHLLIIDIGGGSALKFMHALPLFKEIHRVGDTYFPETLGKMVLLRAPTAAGWLMAQVRGFLDKPTQEKMVFTYGDHAPILAEHLPSTTHVPAHLPIGPWPKA